MNIGSDRSMWAASVMTICGHYRNWPVTCAFWVLRAVTMAAKMNDKRLGSCLLYHKMASRWHCSTWHLATAEQLLPKLEISITSCKSEEAVLHNCAHKSKCSFYFSHPVPREGWRRCRVVVLLVITCASPLPTIFPSPRFPVFIRPVCLNSNYLAVLQSWPSRGVSGARDHLNREDGLAFVHPLIVNENNPFPLHLHYWF